LALIPLWLLVLALLAAAAAQGLAREVWLADLVALSRNLVVLAALGLLAACLVTRRLWLVLAAGLALAVNVALLFNANAGLRPADGVAPAQAPLTVATYNVGWEDAAFEPFAAWARRDGPEVIALAELSDGWRQRLPELVDAYPYRASRRLEGDIRQDVLSRSPIRDAAAYRPVPSRSAVAASVETLAGPLEVVVLDPPKPKSQAEWRARNAYLALAAQWASQRGAGRPAVVTGVWYVTPWSPTFRDTLTAAGVASVQSLSLPLAGPGALGRVGALVAQPLDHLAVTPTVATGGCALGPDLGGEHRPLLCRLRP